MSAHETGTISETARQWVIRTQDASFADWDALAEWLEQDPAHLAAYDAAVEDERWAEDLFRTAPAPSVVTSQPARFSRRWAFVGTATAAALAVIGGWTALDHEGAVREVATAAGEHRTIDLADGSRMVLNGATRVAFDASAPREVALLAGEALFDVKHDPRDPFVVTVGDTQLVDVGTVFNVVREGEALDVAVSHGAVLYAPGKDEIRLDAGAGLSRASARARPVVRSASIDDVGSWQQGQLHYDDAPLDRIGRDLSRNLGTRVDVEGGAAMRFSGTLVVTGAPEQVFARAGPLIGVRFTRGKDGWTMTPTDAAPH